jgi:hypothetical protein
MKIANVKALVAKLTMVGLAAGALVVASPSTAQAQQFAVGVQFGHPAYVVDGDDYRYDRDGDYARRQAYIQHEQWEREQREEIARRQAYLQHEQWEQEQREAFAQRQAYLEHERHEQWERAHRFHDNDDDR